MIVEFPNDGCEVFSKAAHNAITMPLRLKCGHSYRAWPAGFRAWFDELLALLVTARSPS